MLCVEGMLSAVISVFVLAVMAFGFLHAFHSEKTIMEEVELSMDTAASADFICKVFPDPVNIPDYIQANVSLGHTAENSTTYRVARVVFPDGIPVRIEVTK